jgi:hypothetical protein
VIVQEKFFATWDDFSFHHIYEIRLYLAQTLRQAMGALNEQRHGYLLDERMVIEILEDDDDVEIVANMKEGDDSDSDVEIIDNSEYLKQFKAAREIKSFLPAGMTLAEHNNAVNALLY